MAICSPGVHSGAGVTSGLANRRSPMESGLRDPGGVLQEPEVPGTLLKVAETGQRLTRERRKAKRAGAHQI